MVYLACPTELLQVKCDRQPLLMGEFWEQHFYDRHWLSSSNFLNNKGFLTNNSRCTLSTLCVVPLMYKVSVVQLQRKQQCQTLVKSCVLSIEYNINQLVATIPFLHAFHLIMLIDRCKCRHNALINVILQIIKSWNTLHITQGWLSL